MDDIVGARNDKTLYVSTTEESMQMISLPNSPLVPRLTLDVFLSRLVGIVDVEDSDDSDEELVPRMSDDAEPFDLVRG